MRKTFPSLADCKHIFIAERLWIPLISAGMKVLNFHGGSFDAPHAICAQVPLLLQQALPELIFLLVPVKISIRLTSIFR